MSRHFIIIVLCFLGLSSCKESNFIINKDENGKISEKFAVNEAGQKHGEYLAYINGAMIERSQYKDGKLHGTRIIYHSNGQKEIEEQYDNDLLVGSYKSYHTSGQLSQEAQYVNGMMEGLLKTYYEDGSLKEEVTMVKNEENGPFKEYHPNGKIKWEGQFLNGDNEFGLLKNYDESGTLIKKMNCDSLGVCATIWTIEKGDINK